MAKEYIRTLTLTPAQIKQAERAQRETYNLGLINPNSGALQTALGRVSGVLGLVFIAYTAFGVATGTIGLIGSLSVDSKQALKNMVNDGNNYLRRLIDICDDNPKYQLLEVELPFVEYSTYDTRTDYTIRYIIGQGAVKRVKVNGGWILL